MSRKGAARRIDPGEVLAREAVDWRRRAISAFLAFQIAAIASWCLPVNSQLNDRWKQTIGPYMRWSGLFQAWDMFAPDPVKLNSYVDAQVTFRNGASRTWSFPRMDRLGLVDRYFKERYRKFSTEYLRMDTFAAMWPDAARFIARANFDAANPPVTVQLTRHWSEIYPPTESGLGERSPWRKFAFFTYSVKPGDLP